MKYLVTRFKDLKICLKAIEPYIRDGENLHTGERFKQFGNLSLREILANWLLCIVVNFDEKSDRLNFCTDPQGGDGILYDSIEKNTWSTEHVLATSRSKQLQNQDAESLILAAIEKKQKKGGAAYASGKILVVFLTTNGSKWTPNNIVRQLSKIDFQEVWIVGLHGVVQEEYIYNITRLESNTCPAWQVRIKKNFDGWEVKRIQ